MKYVITMCDGEWLAPVPMSEWLDDNADGVDVNDAMHDWLLGRPFIVGGGAAPQFQNHLIDLPA